MSYNTNQTASVLETMEVMHFHGDFSIPDIQQCNTAIGVWSNRKKDTSQAFPSSPPNAASRGAHYCIVRVRIIVDSEISSNGCFLTWNFKIILIIFHIDTSSKRRKPSKKMVLFFFPMICICTLNS